MDFNSQVIIIVVEYVFQTPPWYHRHRSFTGKDSSANRVFTLLHHLPPLPFISPSFPFLSLPLHHNHRCSSSSSSVSLVIVIGIPLHHRNRPHWYFAFFSNLFLAIASICLSDAFKASKISIKNPIFYAL